MVDLERDKGMFQVHPESQPRYTGVGLMEQIKREYKYPAPSNESLIKQINNNTYTMTLGDKSYYDYEKALVKETDSFPAVLKENNSLELIKDIKVENDEVVDTSFYGDIMDDINIKEQEQYVQLLNTFLNRRDKRKLKKYKGFKSFTDRIYGR